MTRPRPTAARGRWLMADVAAMGRETVSAEQYEELRAVALAQRAEIDALAYEERRELTDNVRAAERDRDAAASHLAAVLDALPRCEYHRDRPATWWTTATCKHLCDECVRLEKGCDGPEVERVEVRGFVGSVTHEAHEEEGAAAWRAAAAWLAGRAPAGGAGEDGKR